jgi:SAM-dependent methyltransferase
MLVASLNLNKRIGGTTARSRLLHWLDRNNIALLLAQEPWRPAGRAPVHLDGFRAIGGTDRVFAWIRERFEIPPCQQLAPHWQRLELGYLAVHHAYLGAHAQAARAAQLHQIQAAISADGDRPALVVGDFNLAPRPHDGLFDGHPSSFNADTDREPFHALLAACLLHDTTAGDPPEFSVVRSARGKRWQFRCDLALLSDYLAPSVTVTYDHQVRTGAASFTDHSALLIDLPVSPPSERTFRLERLFELDSQHDTGVNTSQGRTAPAACNAHKTAMTRRSPSPFARNILEVVAPKLSVGSILDYGCGRGTDVIHYRQRGLHADGYDPYPPFGWAAKPTAAGYDLVTLVFVLNVLPDPWERVRVIKQAATYLRPGGYMLVVTRSPRDIQTRAAQAGWIPHNDGYWSSERQRTFQHGISEAEIDRLARRAGLSAAAAAEQHLLRPVPAACQLLLTGTPP